MKIWARTEEFSEGKFLVIRRDGTIPAWPHFVLGARDPAAPAALRAYAAVAESRKFDPEFVASVRELAVDFHKYRLDHGDGDPDAAPHRVDAPFVLHMMRHNMTLGDVLECQSSAAVLRAMSNLARAIRKLAPDLADQLKERAQANKEMVDDAWLHAMLIFVRAPDSPEPGATAAQDEHEQASS